MVYSSPVDGMTQVGAGYVLIFFRGSWTCYLAINAFIESKLVTELPWMSVEWLALHGPQDHRQWMDGRGGKKVDMDGAARDSQREETLMPSS